MVGAGCWKCRRCPMGSTVSSKEDTISSYYWKEWQGWAFSCGNSDPLTGGAGEQAAWLIMRHYLRCGGEVAAYPDLSGFAQRTNKLFICKSLRSIWHLRVIIVSDWICHWNKSPSQKLSTKKVLNKIKSLHLYVQSLRLPGRLCKHGESLTGQKY